MKTEHQKKIAKWKILDTKTAFKNRWWDIKDETVLTPSGEKYHFFVNHALGGVIVFPVTADGKVILIRQYKHGARSIIMELPIGRIEESDRSLKAAAARELREETGYAPAKIELLGSFNSFATSSTARLKLFVATGCRKIGEPQDTATEIIDVLTVSPDEARELAAAGKIPSLVHVGAIYSALEHLHKL